MVTKKTHPVVAAIINDLQLVDGEVLLGADKLMHWSKKLKAEHAGPAASEIYLQLGGYALTLAKKRAPAALEFVALATLPDAAQQAASVSAKKGEASDFAANAGLRGQVEQLLGNRADPRAPVDSSKPKPTTTPRPKRGLR